MRVGFLAIVALACCMHMLQHLVTLSAATSSESFESLLVRSATSRPHHPHHLHHHQQNLTLTFTANDGTLLGHVDTTPGICFALSVTPSVHSGWLEYKNTTNQWALLRFSDAECNNQVDGMEGDGIGGIAWSPEFQAALTSAPIITQYTTSWPMQGGNSIPFMGGIVDGECETWLFEPSSGGISWKYVIVPSNNTWQYFEWDNNPTCSGPPGVFQTAEIGSAVGFTMVVTVTNDYTCGGAQWGSCPPNTYCSTDYPEFVCTTYGGSQ